MTAIGKDALHSGRALSGTGSHALHEAPAGLRPSGFDPARVEWRTQTAKYSFGKDLIVGGIKVGSAFYDGVSSMATADRYKIETRLPGMRPKVDRFATEDEAKIALERVTLAWFARTLPAIATEAGTAETPKDGSVHEGAGRQASPKDGSQ